MIRVDVRISMCNQPTKDMKKNPTQDAIVRELLNRIFVDNYKPNRDLDRAIEDSLRRHERKGGGR